jgi:hypothetical protein
VSEKIGLLKLVDTLIGNVLQGNVFTNSTNYLAYLGNMVNPLSKRTDFTTPYPVPQIDSNFDVGSLYTPYPVPQMNSNLNPALLTPTPVPVDNFNPIGLMATPVPVPEINVHDQRSLNFPGNVNPTPNATTPFTVPQTNVNDHRALNFIGPDPVHPHNVVAGTEAGRSLFPLDVSHKMHDNRYAFLNNNVSTPPKNAVDTPMAKRTEIYSPSTIIPSSVNQQLHGPINSTAPVSKNYGAQGPVDQLETRLPRSDIYAKSDDSIRHSPLPPAPSLNFKGPKIGDVPTDFNKKPLQQTREEIYQNKDGSGAPQFPDGKPPAPSLNFKGPLAGDTPSMESVRGFPLVDSAGFPLNKLRDLESAQKLFQEDNKTSAGNLGNLKNNLYDNGPISFVQGGHYGLTEGFPGALRGFDIFAIAHWVRNIGSEISFLPKFVHDPISKQGSFQGPLRNTPPGGPNGAETIIKSTQWLATNLLLASLNTGDVQSYGPTNLVWNPLSLLSAMLPARGISPSEHPTIGTMISNYKDNFAVSVAAGAAPLVGERMLLMRKGAFSTVSPIKRLANLRSPVAPPGFIGPLNGPLSTLDDELDINKLTTGLPGTIDLMTGEGDQIFAGTGQHTNLYHAGRPYNHNNAAYPLHKLETEFSQKQDAGVFDYMNIPDIKMNAIFSPKAFPGAGGLSSGRDMTYVANPFARFATNRGGLARSDLPDNVDVAFSVEDETEGIVSKTIGDDKNYFPFMFQDLRHRNEQFLYLRAFLKSMTETFTPEWNEDRFYGRTEPVPIYKGTMRTINLSFDMVAWRP